MGCSTCKSVEEFYFPEMGLEYHTTHSRILGIDTNYWPIEAPLIPAGRRPRGGWSITLHLKGQKHHLNGSSARSVVSQAKRLAKINDMTISELDLWLNCNVFWVRAAIQKYQKVSLDSLLSITQ